MQVGLTLSQIAQPVSCPHHAHLSCTYALQGPHPLGSMGCPDPSISSGTTKQRAELTWESQATAPHWNNLPWASCSTLAGHLSTLQLRKGASHRAACASHVLQCNALRGVAAMEQTMSAITCQEGEQGQSQILNWTLHAQNFMSCSLAPLYALSCILLSLCVLRLWNKNSNTATKVRKVNDSPSSVVAQGSPTLHTAQQTIQRGRTWRVQEWRGAWPSNPGTQTTLALLLVTWLTVTLRGGRGMATKETKRPFSIHRTEQVFTRKWQRLKAGNYALKSLTEIIQYHIVGGCPWLLWMKLLILTLNKLLASIL